MAPYKFVTGEVGVGEGGSGEWDLDVDDDVVKWKTIVIVRKRTSRQDKKSCYYELENRGQGRVRGQHVNHILVTRSQQNCSRLTALNS